MKLLTLEMTASQYDDIFVNMLKIQWFELRADLSREYSEEYLKKIKKAINHIEKLLKYYMTEDDYDVWLNSSIALTT